MIEATYKERYQITIRYEPQVKGQEFDHSNVWRSDIVDTVTGHEFDPVWFKKFSKPNAIFGSQKKFLDVWHEGEHKRIKAR